MGALASAKGLADIAAMLLFVLALAGLSRQQTSRRGNALGAVGMALALAAAVAVGVAQTSHPALSAVAVASAIAAGGAVGTRLARGVSMTQVPELVAALHSFVGTSAVLVGWGSFLQPSGATAAPGAEGAFLLGEAGLAVLIGAVTLSGSVVAYGKLSGRLAGRPLTLPGKNAANLAMLAACIVLVGVLVAAQGPAVKAAALAATTCIALFLGLHLVASMGGGDMPVAISMLNSYSGWAAAMAGFALENDLLVVTGALVGSSGAYLSYVMCRGMNRSFASVVLGGLEGGAAAIPARAEGLGAYAEATPAEVAALLEASSRVVVAPGYGMATAQAQHCVADLASRLSRSGADVRFAVHPVAGRMPGHMNVLLAEAKVPYSSVLELDEINDDFAGTDTVLVVGANDTVNPAAETEPASPIAGMPVLRVWEAANVVVLKRSMGNAGYAGVANPLFCRDNTLMLLGDAKESVEAVLAAMRMPPDDTEGDVR